MTAVPGEATPPARLARPDRRGRPPGARLPPLRPPPAGRRGGLRRGHALGDWPPSSASACSCPGPRRGGSPSWRCRSRVLVEVGQLYHAPWIDSIRRTTLGGLVLGLRLRVERPGLLRRRGRPGYPDRTDRLAPTDPHRGRDAHALDPDRPDPRGPLRCRPTLRAAAQHPADPARPDAGPGPRLHGQPRCPHAPPRPAGLAGPPLPQHLRQHARLLPGQGQHPHRQVRPHQRHGRQRPAAAGVGGDARRDPRRRTATAPASSASGTSTAARGCPASSRPDPGGKASPSGPPTSATTATSGPPTSGTPTSRSPRSGSSPRSGPTGPSSSSKQVGDEPFFLVVAMGPPHDPYGAPEKYMKLYDPAKLTMRPNWVEGVPGAGRKEMAAYYAAITAVDEQVGRLMRALEESGRAEDTIVLVHLGPRRHAGLARAAAEAQALGGVDPGARHPPLPGQGQAGPHDGGAADPCGPGPDAAGALRPAGARRRCRGPTSRAWCSGTTDRGPDSAFFQIFVPFAGDGTPHPWRGVRTDRHMYARTEAGPWVLYDLEDDPYEMKNLAHDPAHAALREEMEARLAGLDGADGRLVGHELDGPGRGQGPALPVRDVLHDPGVPGLGGEAPGPRPQGLIGPYASSISAVQEQSMQPLTLWYAGHASA